MYSAFDLLFNLLCFFWKWNVLFFLCSFISYGSNSITCQRKNAYSIQNTHHRKITIFSQKEKHSTGMGWYATRVTIWHRSGVCFTNTLQHDTVHHISLSLSLSTRSSVLKLIFWLKRKSICHCSFVDRFAFYLKKTWDPASHFFLVLLLLHE